jgi:glycosyltransferase involved in cell wall biosynthesis
MVNQFQLLELRKRDLKIFHRDLPFYNSHWSLERNNHGLSEPQYREIAAIPQPPDGYPSDVSYRIGFPYRLNASNSKRLYVFGTSEFQNVEGLIYQDQLREGLDNPDLKIITPSSWSAEGFWRAGFDESRVLIIPHGVDLEVFKPPTGEWRAEFRRALKIENGEFAILSVGAMTPNKGIGLLIFAYALLRRKHRHVRLVLKDQKNLYNICAKDIVNQLRVEYPLLIDDALDASIIYISQNVTIEQLGGLYGAVDCYASPYMAEGFNLTHLEAAACGTPIVVTRGGATDDYVDDSFALQIEGTRRSQGIKCWIEPDVESLVQQLTKLVEGKADKLDRGKAVEFIGSGFSWPTVVDALVDAMFE